MKRLFCLLVAAGALAAPASAQLARVFDNGQFAGRLGVYVPVEQSLRDLDTLWLALGFDYEIEAALFKRATTVFSVDFFTHNGGSRDNIFPLTVSQRVYGSRGERTVYFQVGIGATVLDFAPSQNVFSVRAGVGIMFTEKTFVEGNFYWTDEPSGGTAATGFAVFGGVRF